MINVCSYCFRLNPLGETHCLYCADDCKAMESADYGQFRENQLEILKKEEERFQAENNQYPDWKIFEDYRMMSAEFDLMDARP